MKKILAVAIFVSTAFVLSSCGLFSGGADVPAPAGKEKWVENIRRNYPGWQPGAISGGMRMKTKDAESQTSFAKKARKESPPFIPYTVKAGDSLWRISKHFYGDPLKWRKISEANSEAIKNPGKITPGMEIIIPADVK